jgi:hypothetical protein
MTILRCFEGCASPFRNKYEFHKIGQLDMIASFQERIGHPRFMQWFVRDVQSVLQR